MKDNVRGGVHRLKPMHRTPVDKKRKAKEQQAIEVGSSSSGPDYPYGLELDLNHESLDKLGVKELPTVGHHVAVHARAKVTHAGEHDDGNGKRRSLRLQITHLGVGKGQNMTPTKSGRSKVGAKSRTAPGKVRRYKAPSPPAAPYVE